MTYGRFCDMLPVFAKINKICDFFFFLSVYVGKRASLPFFFLKLQVLLLYLLLYIFFCLSNSAVVE